MAKTTNILAATVFGISLALSGSAWAKSAAQMAVGGKTTQPIGHHEFCQQYRQECNVRSGDTRPTALTRERFAQMVQANTYANMRIKPVTDIDNYGVEEFWAYPKTMGDCEDYALLKRHMLMSQGWPASSLLLTVARQKSGDGHAVLTVRTDRGDFILDNLEDRIVLWNDTNYTYLKRVSADNSGKWEDILDTRLMVGSVK